MYTFTEWLGHTGNAALFISLISLSVSMLTTWINLRRGHVRVAQPRRIILFPKAVYADLILMSTGTRGRILEELVLKMTTPSGVRHIREWVHIKNKEYSQRASIFIPFSGYVASHEWYYNKNEAISTYEQGYHSIEIFDVSRISFFRRNGRKLFKVKFWLSITDILMINSQGPYSDEFTPGYIELDWNFFIQKYEVSYQPPRSLGEKDIPPFSTGR